MVRGNGTNMLRYSFSLRLHLNFFTSRQTSKNGMNVTPLAAILKLRFFLRLLQLRSGNVVTNLKHAICEHYAGCAKILFNYRYD